ncbi:MAG: hypothetical protein K2M17_00935 [Bacilli bacterium]|nr:hypothetical protein [Bacilli bacterium]
MNNLLVTFILLNIVNVIVQTAKSIITVKGGKGTAAITNALAYGFYTIVVVYMLCELPLLLKALVIGLCNLVGVYLVKLLEEKGRKDKIWKVELSIDKRYVTGLSTDLEIFNISYNHIATSDLKYELFNCYLPTQQESILVNELAQKYHAKYFITETKSF